VRGCAPADTGKKVNVVGRKHDWQGKEAKHPHVFITNDVTVSFHYRQDSQMRTWTRIVEK